jgi:putative oxidoreductase
MKKLLSIETKSFNKDLGLLVGRIAIAALMLSHGLPKLQMFFSGEPVRFPSVLGMSGSVSLGLAIFAEVFCSIFILFGFGTRVAVLPLIITMAVAVFSIHATDGFAKKEPALLYLAGYVVLLIAGSGKYSIDHMLVRPQEPRATQKFKPKESALSSYQ